MESMGRSGVKDFAGGALRPQPVYFEGKNGLRLRGDLWQPTACEQDLQVLMLHGGGQTRHSWRGVGARLSRIGVRVTCIDTRGHGDSDWSSDRDYLLPTLADDVIHVLRQIGRPVAMVGASLGGLTALYASRRLVESRLPERMSALVLVDIVPHFEDEGSTRIQQFMASGLSGFETLEQAADAIANYLPHRTRRMSQSGLRRILRLAADGKWYWHWDPAILSDSHAIRADDIAYVDQAAKQITIPALLVRGLLSDVVTDNGVARLKADVPQLEVVDLPRAAHTAAGDDNDAFSAAVIDFLVRIAPSSAVAAAAGGG
jgi:pimeloyl-ACP methyl ester carboxylesterase